MIMPSANYLLNTLEEITKTLLSYPIKEYLYDDSNTNTLCSCIEALFLHSQLDATFTKIARFIRPSTQKQPSDFDFWIFIKHYLPKTLIEIIEKSSKKRSSIGCCRVWVRLALNESTLLSYIEALLNDINRLSQFYDQEAVLRSKEFDSVLSCLHRISQLPFHLNLTCPSLNKWSNSIALQLAKADCVIIEDCSSNESNGIIVDFSSPTEESKAPTIGASAYSLINNLSGPLWPHSNKTPCSSTDPVEEFLPPNRSRLHSFVSPLFEHFSSKRPASDSEEHRRRTVTHLPSREELRKRESRLNKVTEAELDKEITKLRSQSAYSISPLAGDRCSDMSHSQEDVFPLPAGCNSLVYQQTESWWQGCSKDTTEEKSTSKPCDSNPPLTYSETINQGLHHEIKTDEVLIDSGLHDRSPIDNSDNADLSPQIDAPDTANSKSECEGWDMLTEEIVRPSNMPSHLLELYPGVPSNQLVDRTDQMLCNYCQVKLNMRYSNLDYYDGRYYCGMCHVRDKCIIPRDVIQHWDFTPKHVSTVTKRFLTALISHPNIHLGQQNPSLYSSVPNLTRLKYLRRQLSMFWYQLTLCSAKVSQQLKCAIFPREYMLGSLREVDLYSLEDLINAKSGVLEHQLQYVIDRIALPHVRSCPQCQEQAVACDICRCDNKLIQLYEIDSYRRCCTLNCCTLMHTACLPTPDESPIYCRRCRALVDQLDERPPSIRDYDAIFPN